ncbi:MAG: CopG family transcriptional regulator [Acidobacteriota bacterium]|jgi:Arc/MetJ-type ribon-helix-helix transcriptional regulator
MEPRVTLKIPRPLYDHLAVLIEGSGFASVTEFVVYVLRDLVSHQEGKLEGALSAKEIEAIRQRLKSMGYL